MRTDDIVGANAHKHYAKFVRMSPRNPLEPFELMSPLGNKGGELKYFGPKCKDKFLRETNAVDDIEGATKQCKYQKIQTRNHIRSDDIDGATVKIYHKIYYDK